jgi:hypothetical protein
VTICPCLEPCGNPQFCALCRAADARKARGEPPRYIEASRWQQQPPDYIPDNWQNLSIEALMVHFDRARRRHGAPQRTVEALMHGLRQRGTKALEESATKQRLFDLSEQQVIDVGNRLQQLKPEIAHKWTKEEVKTLFQARTK